MGDKEDSSSHISCLTDSASSLCSVTENDDSPVKDQCLEVEDFRISCSNDVNLNKIMKIVAINVKTFANSACSEDTKSQFVSRTLEVFKDYIQDNVLVKGLPYTANADCFSPDKKEIQYNEAKDALFAELSMKINTCASKRKECPKSFCRIFDMRVQHERHNLKRVKLKHALRLPVMTKPSFQVDLLSSQKLIEADMAIKSSQAKNLEAVKELKEIRKNLDFAQEVMIQKPYTDALSDTGYNSS